MTVYFSNDTLEYLKNKDETLKVLIKKYKIVSLNINEDIFYSIVSNIIGQMLSLKVSQVLVSRLEKQTAITPYCLSKYSVQDFVKLGISSKKADYIIELSNSIISNSIKLDDIYKMTDDEAKRYLMSIKGVGDWTADMILLFSLGSLNVWNYKDVALKNGIMKAYQNFKTLSKDRFEKLGNRFSPYKSIAALHFYKLNDDI